MRPEMQKEEGDGGLQPKMVNETMFVLGEIKNLFTTDVLRLLLNCWPDSM